MADALVGICDKGYQGSGYLEANANMEIHTQNVYWGWGGALGNNICEKRGMTEKRDLDPLSKARY